MSKGVAFIFGVAVGACGCAWLLSIGIEHDIETRGESYKLQRRDTGEKEVWTIAWGNRPNTSHIGWAVRTKCKEETESNETEHNETSEDNRQGSTSE